MLFQEAFNLRTANHSLVKKYLGTVFSDGATKKTISHFNPWLVLKDLDLATRLAENMSGLLPKKLLPHGVCILADSGLPLGVLTAQAMGRPMYFYNRNPWRLDDINHQYYIFPKPPEGIILSLLDSHITTGFTAKTCYRLLSERSIKVNSVISPITFIDILPKETERHDDLPYRNLAKASKFKDTLFSLRGIESPNDIINMIKARHKEPRYLESPYLPSRIGRLKAIIASPFTGKKLNVRYLDEDIKQELRNAFSSSESDIWSLFTRPKLIKETCEGIGKRIDFNEYDTIVAIGVIGTIFALCLAWHNKYKGKIVSTYEPTDWNESLLASKNVLICTGRLLTGIYLHGTSDDLKKRGINPKLAIALRLAPEAVKFPRSLMLRHELSSVDFEVLAIS